MTTSPEQLENWLRRPEGEHLEYKEARGGFDRQNDLPDYCAALANERGGKLILGVSNRGEAVGTTAFTGTQNQVGAALFHNLRIRVDVEELDYRGKRILIFHVPSRRPGQLVRSTGRYRYPMRVGESLTEMDDETIRRIINEVEPDRSAELIADATTADLDQQALLRFRELWAKESERADFKQIPVEEMLHNLDLVRDRSITLAALILLGTEKALGRYLPDAEVIFEWRQVPEKTPYDFRATWRKAAILALEEIWSAVNTRKPPLNMVEPEVAYTTDYHQKEALDACQKNYRTSGENARRSADSRILKAFRASVPFPSTRLRGAFSALAGMPRGS